MKLQMKVCLSIILFLCSCAGPIKTVKKADLKLAKYKKVAVMPFQGEPERAGDALADYFITEVMDIGFNVIERTQLEKILKEQNLSLSGAIDPETIHKIGNIAGVDALVLGSFHCRRERKAVVVARPPLRAGPRAHLRRRALRRRTMLSPVVAKIDIDPEIIFSEISVRFVNVETGEIIISSVAKKEYTAEDVRDCLGEIAESIKKALEE